MPKPEPRRFSAPRRPAAPTDERRTRLQLFWGALFASLLLSALLTLDLLPVAPLGIAGRLPQVGEIADRAYKAPAEVAIVDRAATEALRRKALEQSPVIYDFDERRAGALATQVADAFQAGRAAAGKVPKEEAPPQTPLQAFSEVLGALGPLPEASLKLLAQRGFLDADRSALLDLLRPAVGRRVVDDAAELQVHLEKRPVLVRELGSGAERRLEPDASLLTVSEARDIVAKHAEQLRAPLPPAERQSLVALAQALVRPNLSLNLRATEERRAAAEASVKEATISLRKGEIIVRDGDPVTERHRLILEGLREQVRGTSQIEVFLGVALLLFLSLVVMWRFAGSGVPRIPRAPRDAVFLLSVLVVTAVGTALGLYVCDVLADDPRIARLIGEHPERLYYLIPVAASTMLVRLVQSAETAALFAVLVSLLAGLQMQGQVGYAFFTLAGSLTGAFGAARVTQRGTLLRAGLRVGIVNVLAIAALTLESGQLDPVSTPVTMAFGFVAGGLSGMLVSGVSPLVETLFSYTTDVRLLELANRDQPLLRELELRAPGTYHHSMMVGHLAEKAAEAIGANALLAKVGGYYHDIGKMRRPQFFVENVTIHHGENRHESLSPSMSARIIQAHVKDGLELGKQNKLAPPIMRGIGEHHGTAVIRFFFEKAKELAQPEKGDVVEEHDYRYPGPKPQTRESGILMLADSVEAASRTLADTSPPRVQQLVQRITNNYFRDGQLDECSLTLRDLHAIARSFIDTLTAIRHERIDYPEPTDAEGRKLEERADEGVVERLEPRAKDRSERPPKRSEDDLRRLGLP